MLCSFLGLVSIFFFPVQRIPPDRKGFGEIDLYGIGVGIVEYGAKLEKDHKEKMKKNRGENRGSEKGFLIQS